MDRLINVKISGSHLWKDSNLAGVQGESNVNRLRITFDEGWDGFAKKVTFWDALGGEPVERTLTADLLEDITQSIRIYLCPIPGEAMAEAGLMTFVVEGYVDGKRARAVGAELEVEYAPIADHAGQPVDPTPTQAEQLQGQIENILSDMQAEAILADDAAKAAQQSAAAAKASEDNAAASEEAAAESEKNAKASEEAAEKAQQAIEGMTITGETVDPHSELPAVERSEENGVVHLHLNLRQGFSGVHVGSGEMPEGYNVQVDPEGEGMDVYSIVDEYLEELQENGELGGVSHWDDLKGRPFGNFHYDFSEAYTIEDKSYNVSELWPLEKGKTYTVVYDGKTYECECYTGYHSVDGIAEIVCILGDGSLASAMNLKKDEPFAVCVVPELGVTAIYGTAGKHKISVQYDELHKLDKAFLEGVALTINGQEPDENGNVEIDLPEGGSGTGLQAIQLSSGADLNALDTSGADMVRVFQDAYGVNPANGPAGKESGYCPVIVNIRTGLFGSALQQYWIGPASDRLSGASTEVYCRSVDPVNKKGLTAWEKMFPAEPPKWLAVDLPASSVAGEVISLGSIVGNYSISDIHKGDVVYSRVDGSIMQVQDVYDKSSVLGYEAVDLSLAIGRLFGVGAETEVLMASPGGNKFYITVDDAGNLQTTPVA